MYEWLTHHGIPVCIVATKADKLSKNRRPKHCKIDPRVRSALAER